MTHSQGFDLAKLPDDAVEVGRIAEAWGIQGWFKVHPYSASSEALFSCKRWFIAPPIRPGQKTQIPPQGLEGVRLVRIIQSKEHGAFVVAKADETPDRNAAESIRSWRVFVPRSSFPTPDANEYYWVDLIGLEVWNREGVNLGRVSELMSTGPHDVLVLKVPDSPEGEKSPDRMIPFVDAFIDEVQPDQGRILVDWQPDY